MAGKRPPWLTLPARDLAPLEEMERLLRASRLHTVCESAECPNQLECFARRTCTFMILGDVCTRACRFCAVGHGRPRQPDRDEPVRIARAARSLGLRHIVVTSVTRDDLADGGAGQFVATVRELRRLSGVTIELLIPDFEGDVEALEQTIDARPDVLAHNVETVPRLYRRVRPNATYERSLEVIARAAASGSVSKSGLMVGLGETMQEVLDVFADLRTAGCEIVTIGQYLRPSDRCLPASRYVSPEEFSDLEQEALAMGFLNCVAGPLVRSSYLAETALGGARAI